MNGSGMLKVFVIAVAVAVGFALKSHTDVEFIGDRLAPDNEVVMFSLTTCSYCRSLRARFNRAGVPFTELFVDESERDKQYFFEVLSRYQAPGGGVGTPSLLVNGILMLNNPDYDDIVANLRFKSS